MGRKKKREFDFDNAQVGDPGPNGHPITDISYDKYGLPIIHTEPEPHVVTFHMMAIGRQAKKLARERKNRRKPTRAAQMLAVAHRLHRELEEGRFKTQRAAAKKLKRSPMRISQILDLAYLAPDIQEEVLFMESFDGKEPMSERTWRKVLKSMDWKEQREIWAGVKAG